MGIQFKLLWGSVYYMIREEPSLQGWDARRWSYFGLQKVSWWMLEGRFELGEGGNWNY